jgi:hypothetical protein
MPEWSNGAVSKTVFSGFTPYLFIPKMADLSGFFNLSFFIVPFDFNLFPPVGWKMGGKSSFEFCLRSLRQSEEEHLCHA